jgi:hypothetical protein
VGFVSCREKTKNSRDFFAFLREKMLTQVVQYLASSSQFHVRARRSASAEESRACALLVQKKYAKELLYLVPEVLTMPRHAQEH